MKMLLLLLGLTLAGCASDIPRPIRKAPATDIALSEVLPDPQKYRSSAVRWGGAIVAVENRRDETWIEVVERRLDSDGQPDNTDKSAGRFLAHVDGFLDPAIFAPKRLVTVYGIIEGDNTREIGEHPYSYPVVQVEHIYLWPIPSKAPYIYYRSPYWYDPWFPWGYPYHPYPRRHPH